MILRSTASGATVFASPVSTSHFRSNLFGEVWGAQMPMGLLVSVITGRNVGCTSQTIKGFGGGIIAQNHRVDTLLFMESDGDHGLARYLGSFRSRSYLLRSGRSPPHR